MSTQKPFLILQLRPEDETVNDEFEAFLKYGGLTAEEVSRVRMEQGGLPEIHLDEYAGVLVGGGPWNVSDPQEKKSAEQKQAEEWLRNILDDVVARDFPYLGMCYGLGALASQQGGEVSKEKYGEDVGPVQLVCTEEGKEDPLLQGLPETFTALCGHKEACQAVPDTAVLLLRSDTCPVQMVRVKENVYATQFHTELDSAGLETRIHAYKHHGYFPPEEADTLIALGHSQTITTPMHILRRFVERYRG